jgi:hypothetical protein
MVNVEILYYSRAELLLNASLYYPSTKENSDPTDICYLQQVKSNAYNQDGVKIGVFQALNSFRSDNNDGINTGQVTIKTDKGIITFINAYDVGTSINPFLPSITIFVKATYVSGLYASNGLDVYIKIIRFDDPNLTRKIEIFY